MKCNHFRSGRVPGRKYFSVCKCGIGSPMADQLCAQQTAGLLSKKGKALFGQFYASKEQRSFDAGSISPNRAQVLLSVIFTSRYWPRADLSAHQVHQPSPRRPGGQGPPGVVGFAVHQHPQGPAHIPGVEPGGNLVLCICSSMSNHFCFSARGTGSVHFGRRGAGPGGEDEGEQGVELHLLAPGPRSPWPRPPSRQGSR